MANSRIFDDTALFLAGLRYIPTFEAVIWTDVTQGLLMVLGMILMIFFAVLIALLANLTGISIFAYFHSNPEMLSPVMTNDQVVPLYVIRRLPVGIYILGMFS